MVVHMFTLYMSCWCYCPPACLFFALFLPCSSRSAVGGPAALRRNISPTLLFSASFLQARALLSLDFVGSQPACDRPWSLGIFPQSPRVRDLGSHSVGRPS